MNIKVIIIIAAALVILVAYLISEIRKIKGRRNNIPVEDEMSKNQKLLAGNRSFHASLFLWLALFVTKGFFEEVETIIGIGILGSAAIYGIYLWYYRIKGTGDE